MLKKIKQIIDFYKIGKRVVHKSCLVVFTEDLTEQKYFETYTPNPLEIEEMDYIHEMTVDTLQDRDNIQAMDEMIKDINER